MILNFPVALGAPVHFRLRNISIFTKLKRKLGGVAILNEKFVSKRLTSMKNDLFLDVNINVVWPPLSTQIGCNDGPKIL